MCAADILRTMPSKAIELSAFDLYKRVLGGRDASGAPKGPGGVGTALAGAMAGARASPSPKSVQSMDASLLNNLLGSLRIWQKMGVCCSSLRTGEARALALSLL
jgi:hypothetical protein